MKGDKMAIEDRREWDDILDFWFPEGRSLSVDAQAHPAHSRKRQPPPRFVRHLMQGVFNKTRTQINLRTAG